MMRCGVIAGPGHLPAAETAEGGRADPGHGAVPGASEARLHCQVQEEASAL